MLNKRINIDEQELKVISKSENFLLLKGQINNKEDKFIYDIKKQCVVMQESVISKSIEEMVDEINKAHQKNFIDKFVKKMQDETSRAKAIYKLKPKEALVLELMIQREIESLRQTKKYPKFDIDFEYYACSRNFHDALCYLKTFIYNYPQREIHYSESSNCFLKKEKIGFEINNGFLNFVLKLTKCPYKDVQYIKKSENNKIEKKMFTVDLNTAEISSVFANFEVLKTYYKKVTGKNSSFEIKLSQQEIPQEK